MPLSLSQLNSSSRATFTTVLGHLFEHSPWVAEETWVRTLGPRNAGAAGAFRDAAHVHAELCTTLRAAPRGRQLALIRAHPDLAGRLAQQVDTPGARVRRAPCSRGRRPRSGLNEAGYKSDAKAIKLTAESAREQASAGLDQLTAVELAEFSRNNNAYAAKFGFPFVICARLNAKETILQAMLLRSGNPPDLEFSTALAEIEKIAWLRLQDALSV